MTRSEKRSGGLILRFRDPYVGHILAYLRYDNIEVDRHFVYFVCLNLFYIIFII